MRLPHTNLTHLMHLDAVSNYQNTLRTWHVSNVGWILRCDLPEVVAQACPCGASIAFKVWRMFHTFEWRSCDSPATPGDFGVSWYELAFYFAILQDIFCLFGSHRTPKNCLCRMTITHPKLKFNPRKKEAYGIKPLFFALLCVTWKTPSSASFTPDIRRPMQAL